MGIESSLKAHSDVDGLMTETESGWKNRVRVENIEKEQREELKRVQG